MMTLDLTYNIALVSDILGHSDIRITQIYAKIQDKAKRETMKKRDEL
jgi:site-specific recombinase XerD